MAKGQLHKIEIQLTNETETEAKKLVLDIHERLVTTTPVDTGWARANWLLAVGKPVEKPVGSKKKIDPAPQAVGVGSILKWKFSQGPAHDTNNVPYIRKLNEGSSKQAPAGFVDKAVQAAVVTANRKKLG